MQIENRNKKLAINTFMLYFRMIFIMLVSLYTSRVVLQTLGVVDYGIYNVVGGVVAMFGVISGSLSAAVGRFLNFEIGKGNVTNLPRIFSVSVTIHIILAIVVIILAELIGIWFIYNKMTIPIERIDAAVIVFHFSVLTFCVNLISIPYNACIIAHENMNIFAYISIIEVILKLLIVYVLTLLPYDKLALYGMLVFSVALFIRFLYQLYCTRHYSESRYKFIIDKQLTKKIFGFTSWNIIGSTSVILSDHGINILLNIFCNPIVNAARGIAMQVNAAVNSFASNFVMALNPQITQSFGAEDYKRYKSLIFNGSRIACSLLTVISIPFIVFTEYVLNIWLVTVPEHTVAFVRLILFLSISESLSHTLTTGLLATGKIKMLQILIGGMRMLNFPISYIVLYLYNIPEWTMIIAILISQINIAIRLKLLKQYLSFKYSEFYTNIVIRQLVCLLIPIGVGFYIKSLVQLNIALFIGIAFILVLITALCIYLINCNKRERELVQTKTIEILNNRIRKI